MSHNYVVYFARCIYRGGTNWYEDTRSQVVSRGLLLKRCPGQEWTTLLFSLAPWLLDSSASCCCCSCCCSCFSCCSLLACLIISTTTDPIIFRGCFAGFEWRQSEESSKKWWATHWLPCNNNVVWWLADCWLTTTAVKNKNDGHLYATEMSSRQTIFFC